MTENNREQLRQGLKRFNGSLTEVARRANVTRQYVSYIVQGVRKNTKILTIACEVLAELEREERKMKSRQLSLLGEVKELQAAV